MKKALSFAVALGLVAGMAYTASAADNLTVGGDARLRGVYKNNNWDASDKAADKTQRMDQRYRLTADVKVNDDTKVSTRIVLSDQTFASNMGQNLYVDRAFMTINMLGGTYLLGRQDASWGNKFLGWGNGADRIKGVYKAGDLTYGAYLEKKAEGDTGDVAKALGGQDFGDGDTDVYAAFLIGKAGDTKYGVLLNYVYADSKAALGAGQSIDGYLVDVFATTKLGPAGVMAEFVYRGGDTMGNGYVDPATSMADPKSFYGGFVGAAMDMDAVSVKGLIAMYDGNMGASSGARDCDNDFAPSLLIGTCNETAIIDFGGTTGSDSDSTMLIGAGADMKVNDKLTLGALIGYLAATEEADPMATGAKEDATLIEYDLTAKYAINQNTTYSLGIAYGDVDKFSADDDAIFVVGNRVDVKF